MSTTSYEPLPAEGMPSVPSGPTGPSSTVPSPKRRRPGGLPVWGWVLIAVGGAAAVVLAAGAFLLGLNAYLTHDLVHEDFSAPTGAFATGEMSGHAYGIDDGRYVVTNLAVDPGGAFTFASFPRRAYAISADVDVVAVSSDGPAFVGVACATAGGEEGYYLVTDAPGTGVVLMRLALNDVGNPRLLAVDEAAGIGTVRHLRLECVNAAVGDRVDVTGYVNGQPALTATDPSGIDGFDAVVLEFSSSQDGASATFDNVDVVVPE